MRSPSLDTLITVFKKTEDPRDPRGVRHDYHGVLVLVFLGLLARLAYVSHIQRWAKRYWHILREPLGFKRKKPPVDTTITRILAKVPLKELQDAFAEFLNVTVRCDEYGQKIAWKTPIDEFWGGDLREPTNPQQKNNFADPLVTQHSLRFALCLVK